MSLPMYLPDVEKIYLGVSDVKKIMLGDVRVWPVSTAPEYVDCGCIYGDGTNTSRQMLLPFKSSSTLKIRFYGQVLAYSSGIHIGCTYTNTSSDKYRFFVSSGSLAYFDIGNRRYSYGINNYGTSFSLETDMDVTFGNGFIANNLSGTTASFPVASKVPNTLPVGVRVPALKICAIQAWETSGGTDELIYDGVPKIRVADNQAGLYDNVSGTFSTDSASTIYTCYGPLMYRWVDASGNTYDAGTQQGLQYSYSPGTIVTWLGGRYYNDYIWFKTDNGCEEPFLNGNGYMYFEDTLTEIKAALWGLSTTIFGREEHYLEITQIPNTVTDMTYAFFDCYALKSCVLPSGVRILNRTFDGAINLTGCTVPDGVETIQKTFFDCQSMTYLSLPASLTAILNESIVGTRLTYIQFRGTVAQWNAIAKGEYWQYSNASLTEIRCTDGTITL